MQDPPTLPALGFLFGGVFFLVLWPLFGNKSLLVSTAFFALGLTMVLYAIIVARRQSDATPKGVMHRLAALLVVASLGTSSAAGLSAYVLATRLTITADAMACARFATISPNEAVHRAAQAWGVDMLDFRTTVSPVAVNETGWMFEAECTVAPSFGESRGVRVPWTTDGRPHFLWDVEASEDWGLLALLAWVDWDTGACLSGCSRR